MNYLLNLIFPLFMLVIDFGVSANPCPNQSRSLNPTLLTEPPFTMSGIEGKYFCMKCCFDGFTKILWDFRKLRTTDWDSFYDAWRFENSNRTLCIKKPNQLYDTGYYRCTATDALNNALNHSIFVYFLSSSYVPDDDSETVEIYCILINENRNLTLVPDKSIPKSDYKIGNDLSFSCEAKSFKPNKAVSIQWLHSKLNSYKNISRSHFISNIIQTGFNETLESNPDAVRVFSNFSISHLQLVDNGTYKCKIEQDGTTVEQIYYALIIDVQIKWTLLLAILVVFLVLLSSAAGIWHYRFDILVVYKTYFDMFPNNNTKEYDLSIIYQDDDFSSAQVAFKIVSFMECQNLHCWLFDRDKQYGQEILIDLSKILTHSHTVLILVSLSSIQNDNLLSNLSSIQLNPSVRRLYVWNPSKKAIVKTVRRFDSSAEKYLTRELNLQSFCHGFGFDWNSAENIKFYPLTSWIISSLPSLVIRKKFQ